MSKIETQTHALFLCPCSKGEILYHTTTCDTGYINSSGAHRFEISCDKCSEEWSINGNELICNNPTTLPDGRIGVLITNVRYESIRCDQLLADTYWLDSNHRVITK